MQYWQRKLQRSVTEMRTSPIALPWPSRKRSDDRGGAEGMSASSFSRTMKVTLSAGLVEQLDALDDDARLDALDHVVDRERADTAGDHRLHLDPRTRARARLGDQRDRARLGIDGDRRLHVRERQRVRERDQLVRALGGLDGGQPGHGGDVALRRIPRG